MKVKRMLILPLLFGWGASGLFADAVADTLILHGQALDMIWLIMAAALVFFMQAGFAMVETGLTRAKKRQQHSHEKSDGLLCRRGGLLGSRVGPDVRGIGRRFYRLRSVFSE